MVECKSGKPRLRITGISLRLPSQQASNWAKGFKTALNQCAETCLPDSTRNAKNLFNQQVFSLCCSRYSFWQYAKEDAWFEKSTTYRAFNMALSLHLTQLVRALSHDGPRKREERLSLLTLQGLPQPFKFFFEEQHPGLIEWALAPAALAYPGMHEKVTAPAITTAEDEGSVQQLAEIAQEHLEQQSLRRREAMLEYARQAMRRHQGERKRLRDEYHDDASM